MFTNREAAGRQLAKRLTHYSGKNALVLAIPRGGVPVAFEIVKEIQAEFSLIITQRLPFPFSPESGFGAITEDGSKVILQRVASNLSPEVVKAIIKVQEEEILRRIRILRRGHPMPDLSGRIVILVDDGIADGSTIKASILMCKKQNPDRIIVASPVSSPEAARALIQNESVYEIIILEKPMFFRAIAQAYEHWDIVPDHEVLAIMKRCQNHFIKSNH